MRYTQDDLRACLAIEHYHLRSYRALAGGDIPAVLILESAAEAEQFDRPPDDLLTDDHSWDLLLRQLHDA